MVCLANGAHTHSGHHSILKLTDCEKMYNYTSSARGRKEAIEILSHLFLKLDTVSAQFNLKVNKPWEFSLPSPSLSSCSGRRDVTRFLCVFAIFAYANTYAFLVPLLRQSFTELRHIPLKAQVYSCWGATLLILTPRQSWLPDVREKRQPTAQEALRRQSFTLCSVLLCWFVSLT